MSDSEALFYRPYAVARKLGISDRTLYRLVERGVLPKPVKFDPTNNARQATSGWRASTIDAYLEDLVARAERRRRASDPDRRTM